MDSESNCELDKLNKSVNDETNFKCPDELATGVLPPESDTRCGFWMCHPKWMRKLAIPEVYLIVYTFLFWAESTFLIYSTGTLTTVERRFQLNSKVSGFITSGRDVVQIILAIPLSQVAGRSHRPRWMSVGIALGILACLMMNSSHFIFGLGSQLFNSTLNNSRENDGLVNLCGNDNNENLTCETQGGYQNMEPYFVIISQFIAQLFYRYGVFQRYLYDYYGIDDLKLSLPFFLVLFGIGFLFSFTIGYTFLDESVPKDKSPIFLAISGATRVIGPLTGSLLTAWALSLWVDPTIEPNITKEHSQWIGAWWLGYFVIMTQMLLAFIGLSFIPRMLPGTRTRILERLKNLSVTNKEEYVNYKNGLRPTTKEKHAFLASSKRLFRNRIYMTLNTHQLFYWATVAGIMTFRAKYMENAFQISASDAMKYIGIISMIATSLGWLTMGFIMSFLKPSTKLNLSFGAGISLLMSIVYLLMMNISCDQQVIHGLQNLIDTQNFNTVSEADSSYRSLCSLNCQCEAIFSPICLQYNISSPSDTTPTTFFNACYAGCSESYKNYEEHNVYSNCKCGEGNGKNLEVARGFDGLCSSDCNSLIYYLLLVGIFQFLVAAGRTIRNIIYFRCVEERDKDLSLGILCTVCSIGMFLYLPVLGNFIDSCCLLWQESCGVQGHCYLYDNDKFNKILHGIGCGAMFVCMILELFLVRWHEDVDLLGIEEQKRLKKTREQESLHDCSAK